jgi:hypothetical protein
MSHFSLLVVGDNIDEQLIPFQEHACTGACPKKYMKFEDAEDDELVQYKTGLTSEFYCSSNSSDGQLVDQSSYDKIVATPIGKTTILSLPKRSVGSFGIPG